MDNLIELDDVFKVYAMGEVSVNAVAGVSMSVAPATTPRTPCRAMKWSSTTISLIESRS